MLRGCIVQKYLIPLKYLCSVKVRVLTTSPYIHDS